MVVKISSNLVRHFEESHNDLPPLIISRLQDFSRWIRWKSQWNFESYFVSWCNFNWLQNSKIKKIEYLKKNLRYNFFCFWWFLKSAFQIVQLSLLSVVSIFFGKSIIVKSTNLYLVNCCYRHFHSYQFTHSYPWSRTFDLRLKWKLRDLKNRKIWTNFSKTDSLQYLITLSFTERQKTSPSINHK